VTCTAYGAPFAEKAQLESRTNAPFAAKSMTEGRPTDGFRLKAGVQRALFALTHLPLVSRVVYRSPVQHLLARVPLIRSIYWDYWERTHPFDVRYGTDTSGSSPNGDQLTGTPVDVHAHGYAGSQPGVMRKVFAMLPRVAKCTFVALGCGKGRPLLVATEFPFKEIVGVELSSAFVQIARTNAERIANYHSGRTRVRIEVGDATEYPIPTGDVVLFMYNPFDEAMIGKMAARVEAALALESRRVFVVYINPKFGGCFDAVPSLRRQFTGRIPCAREELGFGTVGEELVAVWQGGCDDPSTSRRDR
jgi:SAM-dependent methyltransferase